MYYVDVSVFKVFFFLILSYLVTRWKFLEHVHQMQDVYTKYHYVMFIHACVCIVAGGIMCRLAPNLSVL